MNLQNGMMQIIVPSVIGRIMSEYGISEEEATKRFYTSSTYALLEDEGSKFWWFSNEALLDIYGKEVRGEGFAEVVK